MLACSNFKGGQSVEAIVSSGVSEIWSALTSTPPSSGDTFSFDSLNVVFLVMQGSEVAILERVARELCSKSSADEDTEKTEAEPGTDPIAANKLARQVTAGRIQQCFARADK